jgi:hypothetical protein
LSHTGLKGAFSLHLDATLAARSEKPYPGHSSVTVENAAWQLVRDIFIPEIVDLPEKSLYYQKYGKSRIFVEKSHHRRNFANPPARSTSTGRANPPLSQQCSSPTLLPG